MEESSDRIKGKKKDKVKKMLINKKTEGKELFVKEEKMHTKERKESWRGKHEEKNICPNNFLFIYPSLSPSYIRR